MWVPLEFAKPHAEGLTGFPAGTFCKLFSDSSVYKLRQSMGKTAPKAELFPGTLDMLVLKTALQIPALAVHDSLKESSRGSSEGHRHAWIRTLLVVSEIAFACILLVGAGLLIRSFLRVLDVNLGFHPERAAALRIDPGRQYSTQAMRNTYFDEALRRVRDIPGIDSAGLTDALPFGRNRSWGFTAKGQTYTRGDYPSAFVRIISDGYFKAMGISIVAGRDFAESDTLSSKRVIIVNQTLARRLWPGQNPIGQFLLFKPEEEVIGVVADVRHIALEQTSGNEMYLPIRQTNDYASVDLVVRTAHRRARPNRRAHGEASLESSESLRRLS